RSCRHEPGQVEHGLGRRVEGIGGERRAVVEIDGERTVDGGDERDHCWSSDATTAVARRAAPTGPKPAFRPTLYAVANASPAPVGSRASGCAFTSSATPPE